MTSAAGTKWINPCPDILPLGTSEPDHLWASVWERYVTKNISRHVVPRIIYPHADISTPIFFSHGHFIPLNTQLLRRLNDFSKYYWQVHQITHIALSIWAWLFSETEKNPIFLFSVFNFITWQKWLVYEDILPSYSYDRSQKVLFYFKIKQFFKLKICQAFFSTQRKISTARRKISTNLGQKSSNCRKNAMSGPEKFKPM